MRVVVTRPAAAAALTVGRLRRAGLEAVVLPLTEIVALRQARLPEMDGVAALAVTSANALVHASAAWSRGFKVHRCMPSAGARPRPLQAAASLR